LVAIGCFAVVGAATLAILWPRLAFELVGRPLSAPETDDVERTPNPIASQLLALAGHLRVAYEKNLPHIARIAGYLRVGTIFLTFEVMWWVADLATRT
jgi:hypothetical protein